MQRACLAEGKALQGGSTALAGPAERPTSVRITAHRFISLWSSSLRLDLHRPGHFMKRRLRHRAGLPAAVLHDLIDARRIVDEGGPRRPDRRQGVDHSVGHKLLTVD